MSSPAFNTNALGPSLPSDLSSSPAKKEVMNARFTISGRNYNIQIKGQGSLSETQKNLLIEKFKNKFNEQFIIGVSKIQVKLSDTHSSVIINNDNENIQKIEDFYKEIKGLLAPIHTTPDALQSLSPRNNVSVVIQKQRGSAPTLASRPPKDNIPVTTNPTIKHLYLIESYKFVSAFYDKLIQNTEQKIKAIKYESKATHPKGDNLATLSAKVGQLNAQKEIVLNQLVGKKGIYTQTEWTKEIPLKDPKVKESLLKEWSSKAEGKRQKAAEKLLQTSLNSALFSVEPDEQKAAKLHKKIGQSIARDRMKENVVSVSQDGKINFQALGLTTQTDDGSTLNYDIKVQQFGEHITGSMEPRKAVSDLDSSKKEKFYGVNLHAETVSFTLAGGGAPVVSTQLRSGSFDFKDVLSLNPTKEELALPLADLKRNSAITSLGNLTSAEINDRILEALVDDHPQKLYNVIAEIESLISNYRELSRKKGDPPNLPKANSILEKCKEELNKKIVRTTILALPLADLKRNSVTTFLGNYSSAQVNEHILAARTDDDPQKLYNVIAELESYISTYRKLSRMQGDPPNLPKADSILSKCKGELNKKIADAVIIRANEESITDIFEMTQKNKQDHFGKQLPSLGMKLPSIVREQVLNQVEGLDNENKQNWGMISLQTPVNALGTKGAQKQIRDVTSVFKQGRKLEDADTSELDPVYRELKAYENAVSNSSETVGSGLYFNIPTNFIGSKSIRRLFNQGVVDQTRAAHVDRATKESTTKLYHFASSALEKAEKALDSNSSDIELNRYATSLKSLIDQTFKKNGLMDVVKARLLYGEQLKVGDISLKDIPGADAKYEILGRITILMQMLGFQTTGHCRSGNNRTAAWLAKSHQIVGAMAASPTGEIPPPEVMAGKLSSRQGGRKRADHWSLDVFKDTFTSSSIVLQQANKGTQGTKSKVPEFGNKVLQKSLTKGAFDLAGKFSPKLFGKARFRATGIKNPKKISK